MNDALAGSGVGVDAMSWEWIWLEQVPVPFYPNTAVRFLIALDTNLIEFDHDHMDHITQAGINLLTPYSCWKKYHTRSALFPF